jgi:GT2 family glycosyltransferase
VADEAQVNEGTVASPVDAVSVVVITHNRVELLRRCMEGVLLRTSPATTELIIWNNGSTDGTRAYLDSLSDPRLRVVHHQDNIGMNGYAEAFARASAPYLVEVDDDVTRAPDAWDRALLDAFRRLPQVGFLAADLEENDGDAASRYRHHERAHLYQEELVNGVRILDGPTGGACAMTSREIYDRAGGFPQEPGKLFFLEDAAYIKRVESLGYRRAVLADLRVRHDGGTFTDDSSPKSEYWRAYWAAAKRRNDIKRMLLRIPFVPQLNEHFHWFGPLEVGLDLSNEPQDREARPDPTSN